VSEVVTRTGYENVEAEGAEKIERTTLLNGTVLETRLDAPPASSESSRASAMPGR